MSQLQFKPEILTKSGKYFNFLTPHKSEFTIKDVAHALSNICRFTGQVREFYSVAQHSVLVSRIVPEEYALCGLLHDSAEAFLGDVASPLKQLLPDYREIEHRVEEAVFVRFGVLGLFESEIRSAVKRADITALATEKRDLMPVAIPQWPCVTDVIPDSVRIVPQLPKLAKLLFLERYYELCGNSV